MMSIDIITFYYDFTMITHLDMSIIGVAFTAMILETLIRKDSRFRIRTRPKTRILLNHLST